MTIALIADIHGNLPALESVLWDARRQGADRYLFLGDVAMGLGASNETLALMRTVAESRSVYGNEDEALVRATGKSPPPGEAQYEALYHTAGQLKEESLAYLTSFPEVWVEEHPGLPPIFATHKPEHYFAGMTPEALSPAHFARSMDQGLFILPSFPAYVRRMTQDDPALQSALETLPRGVYVMGHKHIQWCARTGEHLLVAPGSCGLALDFLPTAAYALLRAEKDGWRAELRRVRYETGRTLSMLRASAYGRAVRVWSRVLARELETAREQAIPFLLFAESFARERGDVRRPFFRETWEAAFDAWWKM